MKCERCLKRVEDNSPDEAFCVACVEAIETLVQQIPERTAAAVAYMRTEPFGNPANPANAERIRQGEVFAFLQIFHPEMSQDRAIELALSTTARGATGQQVFDVQ